MRLRLALLLPLCLADGDTAPERFLYGLHAEAATNSADDEWTREASKLNVQLAKELLGKDSPLLQQTTPVTHQVSVAQTSQQTAHEPDHDNCEYGALYTHLASFSMKEAVFCCLHFQLGCASVRHGNFQISTSHMPLESSTHLVVHKNEKWSDIWCKSHPHSVLCSATKTSAQLNHALAYAQRTSAANTVASSIAVSTTTSEATAQQKRVAGLGSAEVDGFSIPTLPTRLDGAWRIELCAAAAVLASFAVAALCVRKFVCSKRISTRSVSFDGTDIDSTDDDIDDQKTWSATMPSAGMMTEDEFRQILADAGQDEPLLALPAPAVQTSRHNDPAIRAKAAAEVERILGVRNQRELFGAGSTAERRAEFRRLARLLHPDKRLVTGDRANLALRRIVEAARDLQASA